MQGKCSVILTVYDFLTIQILHKFLRCEKHVKYVKNNLHVDNIQKVAGLGRNLHVLGAGLRGAHASDILYKIQGMQRKWRGDVSGAHGIARSRDGRAD